jgi:molybdenum cofactor synthesis domain-containing protein
MGLVPYEEARDAILSLAACGPLHPRAVERGEALGCVTSVPLHADEPVPPFANTAMDGFAVQAADTTGATADAPVRLKVVATLAAGDAPDREVGAGEAVRIMTGAPMPPGADAVVMVERTRSDDDGATVAVEAPARPGDHVRLAGDDVQAGQVVVEAFTVLGPAHLGVLASLGYRKVPVFPRPTVGVLSTGAELVDGPGPLAPGQIRDSNRPTLLALLAQSGFPAVDLGHAPDDEKAIAGALRNAVATCDAILTTGGVSVGDFDYVEAILGRLGRVQTWKLAIKPAKPLAVGVVEETVVFGLPGNPVSAMVSFELFARPALRQMAGHRDADRFRPEVEAVADEPLRRKADGKLHLVRVVAAFAADGRVHVRSAGAQGSHQLHASAQANALALVPDGEGVAAGSTVPALLLS